MSLRIIARWVSTIMVKRIKGPTKRSTRHNWEAVYEGIRKMRGETKAPVDTEGCGQTADKTVEDKQWRFQTLVSLMLSSQTKDVKNYEVMQKLIENDLSVDRIIRTPTAELAKEIYGVSFHNTKAKNIKKVADILYEKYNSDIPSTYKELMKLPGVGPKMTLLALEICWGKIEGISVDTHVHRISNRLGWVETKAPEQTRKELEEFIPKDKWGSVNHLLVGLGQTICRPVNPLCRKCEVKDLCPVGRKTTKK